MPSPPLAPLDHPLDLDHLARMTLGDAELESEVLAMFVEQSSRLIAAMAALPADAPALAHMLKGSARGSAPLRWRTQPLNSNAQSGPVTIRPAPSLC